MIDEAIIHEAEAYCKAANISPATLAVRALGNSRFFERLKRKQALAESHAAKLREFMLQNPPSDTRGAA